MVLESWLLSAFGGKCRDVVVGERTHPMGETCRKGGWKQAVAPALLELEGWRETWEGEKTGLPSPLPICL